MEIDMTHTNMRYQKYEHVRFQFSDYESYVGSCKAKKAIIIRVNTLKT